MNPCFLISVSPLSMSSIEYCPPHDLYTYSGVTHPKSIDPDRASSSRNSRKRETISSILHRDECLTSILPILLILPFIYHRRLNHLHRMPHAFRHLAAVDVLLWAQMDTLSLFQRHLTYSILSLKSYSIFRISL